MAGLIAPAPLRSQLEARLFEEIDADGFVISCVCPLTKQLTF
jgi:hypothetical protein